MNEDSFWSGEFIYRVNPDAHEYMSQLQDLIRQERVIEATSLADLAYTGTPLSTVRLRCESARSG